MIFESVEDMIGNTPLLKIDAAVHGIPHLTVYAKLEMMNPFGSVKDRIAKSMLLPHLEEIKRAKKTVIESSSGNTAKALAVLCAKNDIPFQIISNRIKVNETRDVLKSLKTKIVELPGSSECPDPNNPKDPLAIIEDLLRTSKEKYHHTDQYFNQQNISAHRDSGKEIASDLKQVDFLFADLGTCGTSVGIGGYLREHQDKPVKIIGVITTEGNYVPGGRNENELYETGFYDPQFYDGLAKASTEEAIKGMRTLNLKAGLLCGPTTGLVFTSMRQWFTANPLTTEAVAVFVACDRAEPYTTFLKKYLPELFSEHKRPETITEEMLASTPDITPGALETLSQPMVVDIRTHFAYAMGHIENSVNISEHLLEEMILNGPSFPNSTIVVVCPVGRISRKYAARLRQQGYDARTLAGGLQNWTQSGKKLHQGLCAHKHD